MSAGDALRGNLYSLIGGQVCAASAGATPGLKPA